MRWLFVLLLMSSPVMAQAWSHFESARFGFSIDVPAGFQQSAAPPANGDGARFSSPDGLAELLIWGRNLTESFTRDAATRKRAEQDDGWRITYSPVKRGLYYVLSGIKDDRIVYLKAVSACRGKLALYFRIEYPRSEKIQYDAMVTRLSHSLKAGRGAECPEG
jgi:hypothetical protein